MHQSSRRRSRAEITFTLYYYYYANLLWSSWLRVLLQSKEFGGTVMSAGRIGVVGSELEAGKGGFWYLDRDVVRGVLWGDQNN